MAQPLAFFLLLIAAAATTTMQCARAAVRPSAFLGKRYIVGGLDGWRTPPREKKDMYMKWAAGIHFYVEDSIEFVYKNDSVVQVDKYGYYHCNVTAAAPPGGKAPPVKDGSALFLLDTPGFVYFTSADIKHCKKGQRLMINVEKRPSPAPAPAPAKIATPPAVAPSSSAPALAPQEPEMTSGAAALVTSSGGRALVMVLCATTLALMGSVRA